MKSIINFLRCWFTDRIVFTQIRVLEESIIKWEKIVVAENIEVGSGIDDGVNDCACCVEYFKYNCVGCPIYEDTGVANCGATPYNMWSSARVYVDSVNTHGTLVKLAGDELAYLKGLLVRLKDD